MVRCSWGVREESPESGAERLSDMIRQVTAVVPEVGEHWFKSPDNWNALEAIRTDPQDLRPLLRRNRGDAPPHKVIEELGYRFDAVNGHYNDAHFSALDVLFGVTTQYVRNLAMFEFEFEITPNQITGIGEILRAIWDPEKVDAKIGKEWNQLHLRDA